VLVTLLVLWVVVVPAFTLAGTYVLSGVLGRHGHARREHPPGLAPGPVHIAPSRPHRAAMRTRDHAGRSRGRTLIQR
jgi:hypothetical protein